MCLFVPEINAFFQMFIYLFIYFFFLGGGLSRLVKTQEFVGRIKVQEPMVNVLPANCISLVGPSGSVVPEMSSL